MKSYARAIVYKLTIGVDINQGHPIYIQHLGSVDLARIREVTEEDRMIKYHIQEYERCLEYLFPIVSKINNRQIDKTFAIVDAKGKA